MPEKHYLLALVCSLLLLGCENFALTEIPEQTQGLAPVYLPPDWQDVKTEPEKPILSPIQLIRREGYLLVLDDRKGVHLIDHTQASVLKKTGFLKVPGCKKMAVHNAYLYVNNFQDLLIFEIGAGAVITLKKRLENAFNVDPEILFPSHHNGYFECVDPNRGQVVEWKDTILTNPQCWR
ncbi:MAG: hypothetical protein HUU01_02055 [Saprospiraceae bacterium]|nr:hypothetical protein [Saprospiraceae bacterium]